jgi:hypothetical protein
MSPAWCKLLRRSKTCNRRTAFGWPQHVANICNVANALMQTYANMADVSQNLSALPKNGAVLPRSRSVWWSTRSRTKTRSKKASAYSQLFQQWSWLMSNYSILMTFHDPFCGSIQSRISVAIALWNHLDCSACGLCTLQNGQSLL